MGHTVEAKCLECNATTTIHHGGGFTFHLLRCEKCGDSISVDFESLGELHLRYLKGLPGPYCMATAEQDRYVQEHVSVEPIEEEEYHREIEKLVDECKCGGQYTFNASPRCQKCHSDQLEEGEPDVHYD